MTYALFPASGEAGQIPTLFIWPNYHLYGLITLFSDSNPVGFQTSESFQPLEANRARSDLLCRPEFVALPRRYRRSVVVLFLCHTKRSLTCGRAAPSERWMRLPEMGLAAFRVMRCVPHGSRHNDAAAQAVQ